MKKKIIAIVIAILIIGGIGGLAVTNKNRNKAISIKTAAVVKGDINAYLSTTAVIQSTDVKQYYGIGAKVKNVNVKIGDKVKKGDILVAYDAQDLSKNVQQAQLQYDNAVLQKQELTNTNADVVNKINNLTQQIQGYQDQIDALKNSKDPSAATKIMELQKSQSAVQQQKDSLKPASDEKVKQQDNAIALSKISLEQAKDNLAKSSNTIVSSIDGTVTVLNAVEGNNGNPAQVAVEVQNLDSLKAKMLCGKYDIQKVTIGESAEIKNGNNIYKGQVSQIDPIAVNSVSAAGQETNLPVYVTINDKTSDLKVNFDVDIDILVAQQKNVIKIPAESIKTEKDGSSYVYIIKGNKAAKQKITMGVQSDMEVEVKDGLTVGDKVILNPVNTISDGTVIKETSLNKKVL